MIVYRIARTEFCNVSGEGAKRYGGRWNLPGTPALYAGSSVSSALLERLTIDPELFAAERYVLYSVMEIDCPDSLIVHFSLTDLPTEWNAIPPNRNTQIFGSELFTSGVVCIRVPSVVDHTSWNYVVNPLAEKFDRLQAKIYPLKLDQRVVRD